MREGECKSTRARARSTQAETSETCALHCIAFLKDHSPFSMFNWNHRKTQQVITLAACTPCSIDNNKTQEKKKKYYAVICVNRTTDNNKKEQKTKCEGVKGKEKSEMHVTVNLPMANYFISCLCVFAVERTIKKNLRMAKSSQLFSCRLRFFFLFISIVCLSCLQSETEEIWW